MRKVLVLGLLAGVLGALVLAVPALSKRKNIEVDDNYFVHKGAARTVTVHRGDKVVWKWGGHNPHNVTVTSGPQRFHSGIQSSGSFSKKVTRRGTYKIICTIHAPKMRMTLKVL